jgi:ribosome-binding factor A
MARHDKVKEAIKQEVSTILHDELKDPRLGFITITDVELSGDMRHAKVFFSVLGKDEDYQKTQAALDSALGFIRRLVAERINLRFAPEIIFREDRSSEYSSRIQEVLEAIKTLEGAPKKDEPKKSRKTRKKK